MTSEELRGMFEKETGFKIFTEPKGFEISQEYVLWLENRALLNAPEKLHLTAIKRLRPNHWRDFVYSQNVMCSYF